MLLSGVSAVRRNDSEANKIDLVPYEPSEESVWAEENEETPKGRAILRQGYYETTTTTMKRREGT